MNKKMKFDTALVKSLSTLKLRVFHYPQKTLIITLETLIPEFGGSLT